MLTLDELFLQILNMSFTGGVVIVFVLLARLLLKKTPKKFSYMLWSVVLFRLVCPFSFESVISLLPTKAAPIPQDFVYQQIPKIDTGITIINNGINSFLPPATPYASINPMQGWAFIGSTIWIIGIAALAVYSVVSLIILKRKLACAVCDGGNVYLVNGLVSPFVMGLFRPKIYLPDNLAKGEKEYILLHEKMHIKRLDHIVKIISFAVLCLHWLNPLAWVAFFLCGKDMEMSCDEAVIKRLGADVKKDYSSSLLALATGKSIIGGSPLAFGEGDTKGRIKNVLSYKKPAFWVIIIAAIAVICVVGGLIANPMQSENPVEDDLPVENPQSQAGDIKPVAFSSATMITRTNGEDTVDAEVTDAASLSMLQSLLSAGALTTKTSVNDAPNVDNYIHIAFAPANGLSDFFIYENNEAFYVEQPYNSIRTIDITSLDKVLTLFSEIVRDAPDDVVAFLDEISQSFQLKDGVARFRIPDKMPNGYATSQIAVRVYGRMPIDEGTNMSIHGFEKENEERNWELGKEYIERMLTLDAGVPDGTEINASFYLVEANDRGSRYNTTISKIYPLREDGYTPSVSILEKNKMHTIIFSDRFNDKLTLTCAFPDGWSVMAPSQGDSYVTGDPVGIYANGEQIGGLFYDTFELYRDEEGNIPYMSVYNKLMLGSVVSWDFEYTEVYSDETIGVATCTPRRNLSFPGISNAGAPTVYSKGILAHNVDAGKYIGMELSDEAVSQEQWQSIAKSLRLSAQ